MFKAMSVLAAAALYPLGTPLAHALEAGDGSSVAVEEANLVPQAHRSRGGRGGRGGHGGHHGHHGHRR